jgi:hypothetical protein
LFGAPTVVFHQRWYWIMIQVEKPLPFRQMTCMMGATYGVSVALMACGNDPLLQAEWAVWSEGQMVAQGSSSGFGGGMFTKENIFKFLGSFPASPTKKYVLELKFTKDGTPLNIANPHLIVTKQGDE